MGAPDATKQQKQRKAVRAYVRQQNKRSNQEAQEIKELEEVIAAGERGVRGQGQDEEHTGGDRRTTGRGTGDGGGGVSEGTAHCVLWRWLGPCGRFRGAMNYNTALAARRAHEALVGEAHHAVCRSWAAQRPRWKVQRGVMAGLSGQLDL